MSFDQEGGQMFDQREVFAAQLRPAEFAWIDTSLAGNSVLVAGAPAARVRVVALLIVADGLVDAIFRSGTSDDVMAMFESGTSSERLGPLHLKPSRPLVAIEGADSIPLRTAVGESLALQLDRAVRVRGCLMYEYELET